MDEEVKKLINLTTIIRAENNITRKVEFGDEFMTNFYYIDKIDQIGLEELVKYWQKKWKSFGDVWNMERQNYRFFYNIFQLFYYSFYQLRENKTASICVYGDKNKTDLYNNLASVNLYGVYNYGKKCIKLIEELNLENILNTDEMKFKKKFSETRNKLLEHNFNPNGFKLKIDPCIWSLRSTDSFMNIIIHRTTEREYDVEIDYYKDYFKLEKILVKIIKKF